MITRFLKNSNQNFPVGTFWYITKKSLRFDTVPHSHVILNHYVEVKCTSVQVCSQQNISISGGHQAHWVLLLRDLMHARCL